MTRLHYANIIIAAPLAVLGILQASHISYANPRKS